MEIDWGPVATSLTDLGFAAWTLGIIFHDAE
jgi:hypothetical protein